MCLTSYLTVYTLLLAVAAIFYSLAFLVYIFGSLRASKIIHKALVESVLGTTLRFVVLPQWKLHVMLIDLPRWLDKTPTSRVIARCTQDIRAGMTVTISGICFSNTSLQLMDL